ncbi:hypothetical protein [Flavobacterium sp.]|uniref:tetratricopeptide repeat protein n=1 Tax=Flavobacterium sp. TaxID=239 RepID=UPI00262EDF05|nr:hypothetical protein [Flavobacterium sp.]
MLLDQRKFKEAIPFLTKAYQIGKCNDILHIIGYCHFQMDEFQIAKDYFTQSATEFDTEKRSLYNLALAEWKLNNGAQVNHIADELSTIDTEFHDTISGYEIGLLYFLLDDFQRASECLTKQGVKGIDLMHWIDLSYSLFRTNKKLWIEIINDSIVECHNLCNEIESNHKDWSEFTHKEKNERLNELKADIKKRQEILIDGPTKPQEDIRTLILAEHCGCLLFDCKRHKTL